MFKIWIFDARLASHTARWFFDSLANTQQKEKAAGFEKTWGVEGWKRIDAIPSQPPQKGEFVLLYLGIFYGNPVERDNFLHQKRKGKKRKVILCLLQTSIPCSRINLQTFDCIWASHLYPNVECRKLWPKKQHRVQHFLKKPIERMILTCQKYVS